MATLHFVCGKAGAGKTTLARAIARTAPAVLFCEDEWIQRQAGPIERLADYLKASIVIREDIAQESRRLLTRGESVVFDFGGNTTRDRSWVRSIFEASAADHRLHHLVVDDATCRTRVRERNLTQPAGLYFGDVSDEQLDEVTLVSVVLGTAFLRGSAQLEELAVWAPGVRIEAGSRDWQHVAMTAAFRAIFRRTSPAARFEFHHRG